MSSSYKPNEDQASIIDWGAWQHIILDAGCGVGLFAIQYAEKHPESLVIAVERTHERSSKLKRRVHSHGLNNLVAIQADVMTWLQENVPDNSLDEIYFLYPNPWPKKKHKKRRYCFHPLWGEIVRSLVSGGKITLASNVESYIVEAESKLFSGSDFEDILKQRVSENQQGRTHFERKYLKRGQVCWDLHAKLKNQKKQF